MKLLICGDSFASDWTSKYPNSRGWPTQIANHFEVTNLAQAGCGEYKILLQLLSADLTQFDKILISHTSPYRLYVKQHPVHTDALHSNSDLIYADIKEHSKTNNRLLSIVDYFENYMDMDYMEFVHNLICQEIDKLTMPFPVLHCTHFSWDRLHEFTYMKNFKAINDQHPGLINHYSDAGNALIYQTVLDLL